MCGILGVFHLRRGTLPAGLAPERALPTLRHRGPEEARYYRGPELFLGATRLALVDLEHGSQPVRDESGRYRLAMNGELFEQDALLAELATRGHRLRSRCDTEAAVHLFEEKWAEALEDIDGQYALAVHDASEHRLLLARDRMGVLPLYYAVAGDLLVFASEAKALFATGLVRPKLEPRAVDAVLALGCVPSPLTAFVGVRAVPPGHWLEARDGELAVRPYWDLPYPDEGGHRERPLAAWAEEFRATLEGAVRRRLRADAPVGLFLSGGIDSSALTALAARAHAGRVHVYTVGFPEPGFDERSPAREVADHLGLEPEVVVYTQSDLAADFLDYAYYLEVPVISTEGLPLMGLARRAVVDVKAVLSGEGADELFGAYDYFRLDDLRRRISSSLLAPVLLPLARAGLRLWLGSSSPFLPSPAEEAWAEEVFGFYPANMLAMSYWRRIRGLVYSKDMQARQASLSDAPLVALPRERMRRWHQHDRSLYVASRLYMSEYFMARLGDRALMSQSLEGRFPFLDRRVQELAVGVPPALKWQRGQTKLLLREAMRGLLPASVLARKKVPFTAPFGTPFVGPEAPEYARELLGRRSVGEFGYFDPDLVDAAVRRLAAAKVELATDGGETLRVDRQVIARTVDGMAVTCVLSTQLLESFIRSGRYLSAQAPEGDWPARRVD